MKTGRRFTFDAAHRLPEHEGKCSRPHGHTYILEIEFIGNIKNAPGSDRGMVVDFAVLKQLVNDLIISKVDHQDLNKVVPVEFLSPGVDAESRNVTTAENLCVIFAERLIRFMPEGANIERLRLYETPDSWAEWTPETSFDADYFASGIHPS